MSLSSTIIPKSTLEIVPSRPVIREVLSTTPVRPQPKRSLPSRIAVIGNYLPRQCGIATFTTDLCAAISAEYGTARLMALPVNDTEQGYDYPARVRWSLAQDEVKSYRGRGRIPELQQHRHGVPAARVWDLRRSGGSHILHLLRALKMPVVTTLHTVLREPNPDQLMVMQEIAELSDRLVVMSQLSSQFLQEIFKVPGSKIDMVPHGVPDVPFLDPNFYKDRFGVEGKAVLLTFGLLSPNKGIENVIQALPADFVQAQECRVYRRGRNPSAYSAPRGRQVSRQSAGSGERSRSGIESDLPRPLRQLRKKWPSSLAPPISISLLIAMRRRLFPERSPMRWARARQLFRLPIGMRLSCWTGGAARWCPFKTRRDCK